MCTLNDGDKPSIVLQFMVKTVESQIECIVLAL